jgi:aromatic-L-amino-acid decarboxylase
MANITALVAVRNVFGAGVVYLSDQTHSSIARGLRSIGLADDELRILATDDSMRLRRTLCAEPSTTIGAAAGTR